MYIKLNGTYLTIDRGDTLELSLPLYDDDRMNPQRFYMQPGDILYIGITEPGQAFEDAVIKKKIKYDQVPENGVPVLVFKPEDTLFMETGKYFISVKLFQGTTGDVTTVLTLTDFFIIGTDLDPFSHCYDDESTGNVVTSVNGQTGEVTLSAEDVGALPDTTRIPTKTSELENDSDFVDESFLGIALSNYATKADVETPVIMQHVTINGQSADPNVGDKVSFEIIAEDIPVESRLLRSNENVKSVLIDLQNQLSSLGTDVSSLDTKLSNFLGLPQEDLDTLSELIEMIQNADADTLDKLTAQIEKKIDKSNIIESLQQLNENANSTDKVVSAKAAAEMLDEHDSLANDVQENENRIINLENKQIKITTGTWDPVYFTTMNNQEIKLTEETGYVLYSGNPSEYFGRWTRVEGVDNNGAPVDKVFIEVCIKTNSYKDNLVGCPINVLLPFRAKGAYTPLTVGICYNIAQYGGNVVSYGNMVIINGTNKAQLQYNGTDLKFASRYNVDGWLSFSGWYTPDGDLITI